jgi:hypothetical protein
MEKAHGCAGPGVWVKSQKSRGWPTSPKMFDLITRPCSPTSNKGSRNYEVRWPCIRQQHSKLLSERIVESFTLPAMPDIIWRDLLLASTTACNTKLKLRSLSTYSALLAPPLRDLNRRWVQSIAPGTSGSWDLGKAANLKPYLTLWTSLKFH